MAAKGILAILGKPVAGGDEPDGDESEDIGSDAEAMAAKDLISAVKASDAMGVKDAFKRMYDACSTSHKSESEEGEGY